MKKLLLALAVATPVLAGENLVIIRDRDDATRTRALQVAEEVRRALTEIRTEAREVAQKAQANGNVNRARRFREVAQRAGDLAQDLRRGVIRPLRQGARLRVVDRNLDRLMPAVGLLGEALADINNVPARIEKDVRVVVLGIRRLQQILR